MATENVTPVELAFAEDIIQMSYEPPKKYWKDIPENINKEVSIHARDLGTTASAFKKFTINYPKYSFVRITTKITKTVRRQLLK